jgi:hypothetical protein
MKRMHWTWAELGSTPRYVIQEVVSMLAEEADDLEDEMDG